MKVTKLLRFLFQVPFARSQIHLLELTEKICENFEEYAQAKWKSNGQPTIIRITNPDLAVKNPVLILSKRSP